MAKAKEGERLNAKLLFIEQHKTAKEIAILVNVSEKTIGCWIEKFQWKSEREARLNSAKSQIDRLRELICIKSDRAIELEREIALAKKEKNLERAAELRHESISLSDEVSKWNKTLENLDKENKVSLSTYLEIMDNIFKDMQQKFPDLYRKTIDFQEQHLATISIKYA